MQKRLKKTKSEEKFVINDIIDYAKDCSENIKQGINSDTLLSRQQNKISNYINKNFLNENDPQMLKRLIQQQNKKKYVEHKLRGSRMFGEYS